MPFDPEAWFAAVKRWPSVVERPNAPASPKGVFPAWGESFDAEWDAPKCTECGSIAPADGMHLCHGCR